jgi:hypothetical protein
VPWWVLLGEEVKYIKIGISVKLICQANYGVRVVDKQLRPLYERQEASLSQK